MNKKSRSRGAVNVGRWISYAAAGAATAFAASNDADAAIIYSGPVNTLVAGFNQIVPMKTLAPGPATHAIGSFEMKNFSSAIFLPKAANQGRVAGTIVGNYSSAYAFKLGAGANIAAQNLVAASKTFAWLAFDHWASQDGGHSQFATAGVGFLGFRFNIGTGNQYGWARVNMQGPASNNHFTLVDYAYGTVGQAITAGETAMPEPASLGLLAIGAAGLLACRAARSRKSAAA